MFIQLSDKGLPDIPPDREIARAPGPVVKPHCCRPEEEARRSPTRPGGLRRSRAWSQPEISPCDEGSGRPESRKQDRPRALAILRARPYTGDRRARAPSL